MKMMWTLAFSASCSLVAVEQDAETREVVVAAAAESTMHGGDDDDAERVDDESDRP